MFVNLIVIRIILFRECQIRHRTEQIMNTNPLPESQVLKFAIYNLGQK